MFEAGCNVIEIQAEDIIESPTEILSLENIFHIVKQMKEQLPDYDPVVAFDRSMA